ncbi:Sua5/YciO/YrdC/YwlC family protein [Ureaplasma ceti]|uniref:L-threonylcarbamoyladenylate synthase n=1 Tax=Ureaplasma ceti TaxID=3119530 RepID=A0ABP9U6H3_9BACT
MKFKSYTYQELESVIFEIKNNKAVIIPTDTVIGVMANNTSIIYKVKNRPKEKKIIKFISDLNDLGELTKEQYEFLNRFWPGQVSVIKDGVSYRMPDDPYILYILSKTGPLFASSANLSGRDTIQNTDQANQEFDIDNLYYDVVTVQGDSKLAVPSTIVNLDNWKIVREGCKINEIKDFIKNIASEKKEVIFLTDEHSEAQEIANEVHDTEIVNITLKTLNKANLDAIAHKLLLDNDLNVFILTKNPVTWDCEGNKHFHIRTGLIYNDETAQLSKQHDNTNIALLDLSSFAKDDIARFVKIYLHASFEGGRHEARVQTITDYENHQK